MSALTLRSEQSEDLTPDQVDSNFKHVLENSGLYDNEYGAGYWTDKSFPLTYSKRGQGDKPDYDFVNRGMLFPEGNTGEKIQIIDQMLHEKKFETPLRNHVHFIQTVETLPIYKFDYKWYNNGEDVPVDDITISTADGLGPAFEWSGNPMLQIIRFPEIFLPNESISSHLEGDIYRDDNVVSGDVLTKYFDYHFFKDAAGSIEEYIKFLGL